MIRSSRLVASAGLAVLLLSGCGSESVRPGAAALVGDQRISVDDLRELVDRGLSDPQAEEAVGQDVAAFQRQALSRMINSEVLEAAAEREGVSVTAGDVEAQLEDFAEQAGGMEALEAQASQNGIAPEDLRPFLRDVVLEQALADALTEDVDIPDAQLQQLYEQNIAQYDRVRSRHILVEDEAQAREVLAQVQQDPSRFEELAAELSLDTSNKDDGGELGFAGRGQFVPEFEQFLFGSQPGAVGLVQTQFGWHVIEVLERDTTTLEQARPELRRAALQQQRAVATGELLREIATDLGVTVNPRFGRWDPQTGTIEPVEDLNGVIADEDDEAVPGAEDEPAPEAPMIEEAPESETSPSS